MRLGIAHDAVLAGRYRLDQPLGEGGMGIVWRATNTRTLRAVALKLLKSAYGQEVDACVPDERRRLLREARAACAVHHPNVVQVLDVIECDKALPILVMELLEGESLRDRLDREPRVPLQECCRIVAQIASGVAAAHAAGVIHRDLKPANIFLISTGGEGLGVKILDFGIAKLTAPARSADTADLTHTGRMLGSLPYMSPEQAFCERNIDPRTDIWSLGIILYECLSGVLPTRADNEGQTLKIITQGRIRPLAEVAPELPSDVTDLVARMLSVRPEDRPATMGEVKAILERCSGARAPSVRLADPVPPKPPTDEAPADDPPMRPSQRPGAALSPAARTPKQRSMQRERAAAALLVACGLVAVLSGAGLRRAFSDRSLEDSGPLRDDLSTVAAEPLDQPRPESSGQPPVSVRSATATSPVASASARQRGPRASSPPPALKPKGPLKPPPSGAAPKERTLREDIRAPVLNEDD